MNLEKIEVLRAGLEHLDQLAPLFDAYRVFYEQNSDVKMAYHFLSERIQNDQSVLFLALLKGEPAGFTQLYPSYTSVGMQLLWILNDLYVDQSARKCGVAKCLMNRAAEFARETQAKRLLLETAEDNIPAKKLYEALGWKHETDYAHYSLEV